MDAPLQLQIQSILPTFGYDITSIGLSRSTLAISTSNSQLFFADISVNPPKICKDRVELPCPAHSIASDGLTFFLGLRDGKIMHFSESGAQISPAEQAHSSPILSLSFQNGLLASGGWDGRFRVFRAPSPPEAEAQSAKRLEALSVAPPSGWSVVVSFLSDGSLAVGRSNGLVELFRPSDFTKANPLPPLAKTPIRVLAEGEPLKIYSVSDDKNIHYSPLLCENPSQSEADCKANHIGCIGGFAAYGAAGAEGLLVADEGYICLYGHKGPIGKKVYCGPIAGLVRESKGDRVFVGAADGSVRVYTLKGAENTNLQAKTEEIAKVFVAESTLGLSESDGVFPLEPLHKAASINGDREGQVRFFEAKREPKALVWQGGKWAKLPLVRPCLFGGSSAFAAGQYDFLFRVERLNGSTLPLPLNASTPLQKVKETVESLLDREGLLHMKRRIEEYVLDNMKETSRESVLYRSVSTKRTLKHFPVLDPIYFPNLNHEGFMKAIEKFNETKEPLNDSTAQQLNTSTPQQLNPKLSSMDLAYLKRLAQKLSVTSECQTFEIPSEESSILDKKLSLWSGASVVPVLDLMRAYALHPDSQRLLNLADSGLKFSVFAVSNLSLCEPIPLTLAFKFFSNSFKHNQFLFAKAEPFLAEFIALKSGEFPPKALSLLLTILNNLTVCMIEARRAIEFKDFLKAVFRSNLASVLTTEEEVVNLLIPLGNVLSLGVPDLESIVRAELTETLGSLKPDKFGFLEDIKSYLGV